MPIYSAPCEGGPLDGRCYPAERPHFNVAIREPMSWHLRKEDAVKFGTYALVWKWIPPDASDSV